MKAKRMELRRAARPAEIAGRNSVQVRELESRGVIKASAEREPDFLRIDFCLEKDGDRKIIQREHEGQGQ